MKRGKTLCSECRVALVSTQILAASSCPNSRSQNPPPWCVTCMLLSQLSRKRLLTNLLRHLFPPPPGSF